YRDLAGSMVRRKGRWFPDAVCLTHGRMAPSRLTGCEDADGLAGLCQIHSTRRECPESSPTYQWATRDKKATKKNHLGIEPYSQVAAVPEPRALGTRNSPYHQIAWLRTS